MIKSSKIKIIAIVVFLVVVTVGVIRIISGEDTWICVEGKWAQHGKPSSPIPTGFCGQAKSTKKEEPLPGANILVSKPLSNDLVTSPMVVEGKVKVFENQFNYRLKDNNGAILVEDNAIGQNSDVGKYTTFSFKVAFKKPATTSGILEVFDRSAKDGREIDKVIIPLRFK